MKKRHTFKKSLQILKNNKILFVPNLLIILVNYVLFFLLLVISGIWQPLLQNNTSLLIEQMFSWGFLLLALSYFLVLSLVDNLLIASKYGMIKDILKKGKTSLSSGLSFGVKYYYAVLWTHWLVYLIVFTPLLLAFVLLFMVLPLNSIVSISLFMPLALVYLVFISLRLLFVYPVLTFHTRGAYRSIKEDFHYVKTHLHHTFLTWLTVLLILAITTILKENLLWMTDLLNQQVIYLGMVGVLLIYLVELIVSVWEHVYIFKRYLDSV